VEPQSFPSDEARVFLPSDDLKVLAQAIDGVVDVVDAGMRDLENGLTPEVQAEFVQNSHRSRADTRAFASAVARVLVLHELRKSGALSYDEFRTLKSRLLGI
jgi:hypothetical protein